ncbi:TPA: tetratricopeptide repeat protein [Pasteurella multocida]|nr:tetratricopeptide repeat protein [Pasteurella multocida]
MTKSEKYFDEAKKAYDHGNFEKAIELLNKINLQDDYLYFQAQSNLALIYEEQGKLDRAIDIYKKIRREDNPRFYANAQLNLARIYEYVGDIENVIRSIELIVRNDAPEIYAEGMANLARIFEERGQLDNAIESYKKIHHKDEPEIYTHAQFNLAVIFEKKGELDKAIEAYRAISRKDSPEACAKAQLNLALIFSEKGELYKAIETYKAISREDSSEIYAQAQFSLAVIFEEKCEQDKAIEAYKAILLEDSPEIYAHAQFGLVCVYQTDIDTKSTIANLNLITKDNSEVAYAVAQCVLGFIYYKSRNIESSIKAFKLVERKCNSHSHLYAMAQVQLGLIYEEQGEKNQAINTFKSILYEDSSKIYAFAQGRLGCLYTAEQRIEDAKKSFESIHYHDSPDMYSLAQVYLRVFELEQKYHSKLFDLDSIIKKILSILHVDSSDSDNDDCFEVAHYTRPSVAFDLIVNSITQQEKVEERKLFRLNTIQGVNDPKEGCILYECLGLEEIVGKKDQSAFISCFTFNHDSLNQFRLYGKDGGREASGVSLVFNVNRFFNNNSEQIFHSICEVDVKDNSIVTKEEHTKTLSLYRCIYLDPKNHYISIAKRTKATFYRQGKSDADRRWMHYQKSFFQKEKELGKLLRRLITILNSISRTKKFKQNVSEVIQYILLPLQYLVKHYAFEEEQECRMIAIHSLIKDSDKVKTDIATKSMYVEYPVDVKNAIEKVYLSVGAREYESFFIKALGDSRKVRISDNPFRAKS